METKNFKLDTFSEIFNLKLFDLCFSYYNVLEQNELFEEKLNTFTEENKALGNVKLLVINFIEVIDKASSLDENFILSMLKNYSIIKFFI